MLSGHAVHRPEDPVRGAEDRDRRAHPARARPRPVHHGPRGRRARRRSSPRSPARSTASRWPAAPRRC
ncbi:MAG: hypothetical protein MZW92_58645 [Comamonadaceae bacterium]|nr:hypothetical protein [Comamonadaceae bacterium]